MSAILGYIFSHSRSIYFKNFPGEHVPGTPLGRSRLQCALKMPWAFYLALPIAKMLCGACTSKHKSSSSLGSSKVKIILHLLPPQRVTYQVNLQASAEHFNHSENMALQTDLHGLTCSNLLPLLVVCVKLRFLCSGGFLWLDFQLLAFRKFLRANRKNTTF